MSFPHDARAYTQGTGTARVNFNTVVQQRAPATSDWNYEIGTVWLDQTNVAEYTLLAVSSSQGINSATWLASGGGSSGVATINTLVPSGGNITIAGTSNQITMTSSGSTVTASIPSAFTAPGSIAATTTVTGGTGVIATTGNVTATAGKLVAGGDAAGAASTTSISNAVNTTQGVGVLSILSTNGNSGNNTGFLKCYVGTTVVYVPYFATIAP
jgi:hypothetical protein